MNRFTLCLCFYLVFWVPLGAQNSLWGLLPQGGQDRAGAIFSLDSAGTAFHIASSFSVSHPGKSPRAGLLAWGGKLWGVTSAGGKADRGLLYSYDPQTEEYAAWHHFHDSSGGAPEGELVVARDGLFYGLAKNGGQFGAGVLYAFDPATGNYSVEHHFSTLEGLSPWGKLQETAAGALLGLAQGGGREGEGVLFAYHPANDHFVRLWDFSGSHGALPVPGLVLGRGGTCYGATFLGGRNGKGVLFSFSLPDSSYQVLHHFGDNAFDGENPGAGPVWQGGALFGTTWYGGTSNGGVMYRFDTLGQVLSLSHHFSANQGVITRGALCSYNHALWGLASRGGQFGLGSLYRFDPVQQAFQVLHHFQGSEGSYPFASLHFSNGVGYGVAAQGGLSQAGTLFGWDAAGAMLTPRLHFSAAEEGVFPAGSLLEAADGWFYGLASSGGRFGHGALFRFHPGSGLREKVHDFTAEGACAGLTLGANGRLYGLMQEALKPGFLFEWDPVRSVYRVPLNFSTHVGTAPVGTLLAAGDGLLYGYTTREGANGLGTIFSYDPVEDTVFVHHHFSQHTGRNPEGSLLEANNGLFYGVCSRGGTNPLGGVLFEWDKRTGRYRVMANFTDGQTGTLPVGGVTEAKAGYLLGVTLEGGPHEAGTVYTYVLAADTLRSLHPFKPIEGSHPKGNLLQVGRKAWGLTGAGGRNNKGAAFLYDLDRGYRKLWDFSPETGSPGSALLGSMISTSVSEGHVSLNIRVYPNPCSDQFWVEGGPGLRGPFQLRLLDSSGRQVLRKSWLSGGSFRVLVEVETLPSGIYVAELIGAGSTSSHLMLHR